jgi:hypothetical protein
LELTRIGLATLDGLLGSFQVLWHPQELIDEATLALLLLLVAAMGLMEGEEEEKLFPVTELPSI